MSARVEELLHKTKDVGMTLCEQVYGYENGTFEGHYAIVEDQKGAPEVPVITRQRDMSRVVLSVAGADRWCEIVGEGCSQIGIETDTLYAATGVALLELANVINYSVTKKDPVNRLRKVDKAFRADTSTQDVCAVLSEYTGIDIGSIVSGLDQDDFAVVSRLRYGLGVALKAYGIEKEKKQAFNAANLEEAVKSIEKYRLGIANYLSGAINIGVVGLGDASSTEITEQVYALEFPYLQVASCMPMNVSMLLNK